MVPMPSSVKISSSSECGTRPSMTRRPRHAALDGAQARLHLRDHPGVEGRQQALSSAASISEITSSLLGQSR